MQIRNPILLFMYLKPAVQRDEKLSTRYSVPISTAVINLTFMVPCIIM